MLLELKIRLTKHILNYYVIRYGLRAEKTMQMSCKIDKLINEKINEVKTK